MNPRSLLLAAGLFFGAALHAVDAGHDYPIQPVPFTAVKFADQFWLPRIHTNHTVTIPIAIRQCEETGRVDNFRKAAGEMKGRFETQYPFDDTDLYKILEGISYTIQVEPDPALEKQADDWIALIGRAQEKDGYLYTARTIDPAHPHEWSGPERWVKEDELSHELYNSGHLYEAAAAHFVATGKRTLLNIALKNADLLCETFGPGKRSVAPGHQIVEMGLVKLYRVTGERRYLDLARFFLDCRGKGSDYSQNHKPVTEQREAVGHSVRATYMYSGMADVVALQGNEAYHGALQAIWKDVHERKLALTGGIGAEPSYEGFAKAYDLPNFSSYNETCAAIGNVYWNQRMFLLEGDARYVDALERSLYNGVISGVSISGDGFFYPNPLESRCNYERSAWFGCACCPSNICRFLPSIPGYAYAHRGNRLYVNLYVESSARVELAGGGVDFAVKTSYPWKGDLTLTFAAAPEGPAEVALRLPAWARASKPDDLYQYSPLTTAPGVLTVNGKPVPSTEEKGYVVISRVWKAGDVIAWRLPVEPRRVTTVKVPADEGRVAFQRGPVVYAWESPDNAGVSLFDVSVNPRQDVAVGFDRNLFGGVGTLTLPAVQHVRAPSGELATKDVSLVGIPYSVWANRGPSDMVVWLAEKTGLATPPPPTLASRSRLTGVKDSPGLRAVHDFLVSTKLNDHAVPGYSAKPKDGHFWLQYDFPEVAEISETTVWWQDTKPWGDLLLPASVTFKVLNEQGQWVVVATSEVASLAASPSEMGKQTPDFKGVVKTSWKPLKARALRLETEGREGNGVGLYEWEVK